MVENEIRGIDPINEMLRINTTLKELRLGGFFKGYNGKNGHGEITVVTHR